MAQIPVSESTNADKPSDDRQRDDKTRQIAYDVAYRQILLANVVFVGPPNAGDDNWVLIDAGLPASAADIKSAARARFAGTGRPRAIVMTHGHFDHVGALETLTQDWDVPVYAHLREHSYLNGRQSYPPPDPSVGGGVMSLVSPLFPRRPVDVSRWLRALPDDHSVPPMPDWRWVHTPGHSPGHISLWRELDRLMIAGDAFITTMQESAYAAVTQEPEMHGPPMYFTPDWERAGQSVRTLAALKPEVVVSGHGQAMRGPQMQAALEDLAARFDEVAVPRQRRPAS
jgi:glyoxylase-like metal-dependent hydrolase (beta-lactamase superfamily II)